MELGVGSILDGKVTGITKFGAFVSLPAGRTGMVHISEIAHSYVNNIREHLTEGQEVKVKIISIDKEGRINLSIKKTAEAAVSAPAARGERLPAYRGASEHGRSSAAMPASFEDKLKQFMSDSDSRMSDLKLHGDKRGSRKRR